MSSDGSDLDDFQVLEPRPDVQDGVAKAIASIQQIREAFHHPNKRRKMTRCRRGPSRTKAKLAMYLLPPGSLVPKFSGSDDQMISAHIQAGYG